MNDMPELILDGIQELVNIGIGKSAGSLNSLTGHHVTLNIPVISLNLVNKLTDIFSYQDASYSIVSQDYSGAFEGTVILIFPEKSSDSLFYLLTGEEKRTPMNDDLWKMTFVEIGNIIINAIMGSIANILEKKIEFHLPVYHEKFPDNLLIFTQSDISQSVIIARTQFSVDENEIFGEILLLLADPSIGVLTEAINKKMGICGEI